MRCANEAVKRCMGCFYGLCMARPRLPAKVLELSGAFKKNPARRKAREAELRVQSPVGPPPAEWVEKAANSQRCKELLEIWHEIIAQDVLRVLNSSHTDCWSRVPAT